MFTTQTASSWRPTQNDCKLLKELDTRQRHASPGATTIYKYYSLFNGYAANPRTGQSYEERIGDPDVHSSGIGCVAIGFSALEDTVDVAIAALLNADEPAARILVSEISFKAKVNILGSLVRERASTRTFNCSPADPIAVFHEMVSLLFRAEELRNQVMHSSWHHVPGLELRGPNPPETIQRRKMAAKAQKGLKVVAESLTGGELLDIYDFMLNVEYELDRFFIDDHLFERKANRAV